MHADGGSARTTGRWSGGSEIARDVRGKSRRFNLRTTGLEHGGSARTTGRWSGGSEIARDFRGKSRRFNLRDHRVTFHRFRGTFFPDGGRGTFYRFRGTFFTGWGRGTFHRYRFRGTFFPDGVEGPSTASEVPFSRMGPRYLPPLPRYLFPGWGRGTFHRFRGTFSSDGGSSSTALEGFF